MGLYYLLCVGCLLLCLRSPVRWLCWESFMENVTLLPWNNLARLERQLDQSLLCHGDFSSSFGFSRFRVFCLSPLTLLFLRSWTSCIYVLEWKHVLESILFNTPFWFSGIRCLSLGSWESCFKCSCLDVCHFRQSMSNCITCSFLFGDMESIQFRQSFSSHFSFFSWRSGVFRSRWRTWICRAITIAGGKWAFSILGKILVLHLQSFQEINIKIKTFVLKMRIYGISGYQILRSEVGLLVVVSVLSCISSLCFSPFSSVAVYLFFYGIYFLIFESDMTGTLQISYFIGYTLIASFAFFLITGAFGFYVSLWFVRRLYSFSRNE